MAKNVEGGGFQLEKSYKNGLNLLQLGARLKEKWGRVRLNAPLPLHHCTDAFDELLLNSAEQLIQICKTEISAFTCCNRIQG